MISVFALALSFMFYEDIAMGEVNQIRISGPESILFDFFLHLTIRFTIEIKLKYQVIGPMKALICVKMSLNRSRFVRSVGSLISNLVLCPCVDSSLLVFSNN